MATAMIAIKVGNANGKSNKIKAVFLGNYGEPYNDTIHSGTGRNLFCWMNTTEIAKKLISKGYIRYIENIHMCKTYIHWYAWESYPYKRIPEISVCTNTITNKDFISGKLKDKLWDKGVLDVDYGYYWTGTMWVIADYEKGIIMPLKDYLKKYYSNHYWG